MASLLAFPSQDKRFQERFVRLHARLFRGPILSAHTINEKDERVQYALQRTTTERLELVCETDGAIPIQWIRSLSLVLLHHDSRTRIPCTAWRAYFEEERRFVIIPDAEERGRRLTRVFVNGETMTLLGVEFQTHEGTRFTKTIADDSRCVHDPNDQRSRPTG
ncbi:MAG: hypothetical protein Q7R83_02015 [bacterium]|nr:hypothetical protein [bacterium]